MCYAWAGSPDDGRARGCVASGISPFESVEKLLAVLVCIFNVHRIGVSSPISLEDYVRLPHVLTTLRRGKQGVVDEALAKLGLSRTVAITTPRFAAVPFLVAGAPLVATSSCPRPSLRSYGTPPYDHDPANMWLHQT